MLYAWLTICLLVIIWLCAFVALAACAPLLLTARHERRARRRLRSLWNLCESLWWLGPRPIKIARVRPTRAPRADHPARLPRRRAA